MPVQGTPQKPESKDEAAGQLRQGVTGRVARLSRNIRGIRKARWEGPSRVRESEEPRPPRAMGMPDVCRPRAEIEASFIKDVTGTWRAL